MTGPPVQRIEFRLLQNSLDFISSALESLGGTPGHRELKYAVLHLVSGVELIFKERLRREHWALVFERPDQASKTKYETGNFNSVSFSNCLTRLVDICGFQFTDERKKRLEALRDKRNRLEHFGIIDTVQALTSDAAAVMSFVLDFVDAELTPEKFEPADKKTLQQIRKKLTEFQEFVRLRLKDVQPALNTVGGIVRCCPSCNRETLIISTGALCLFCGYKREPEMAANDYIADVLFSGEDDWPLYLCPRCRRKALVDETESDYICFACGTVWKQDDLRICGNCNLLFEGNSPVCADCAKAQAAALSPKA